VTIHLTDARDALAACVDTALQALPIPCPTFWDNTLSVDTNTVGDIFLRCGVVFTGAEQATIDVESDRVFGYVWISVFQKAGAGTRKTLEIFDSLRAALAFRKEGGVELRLAYPGKKEEHDGWLSQDLLVDFNYFTINSPTG
jgi:hypothetical protein